MLQNLFRLTLVALIAMMLAFSVSAQSLPGLGILSVGNSETKNKTESDLAAAIRQAAESGVNVIVMDSTGRVIIADGASKPDETAETGVDHMEHGSRLMQAQSDVSEFRAALNERLQSLPNSINEVIFILRATSPDGRIWTYAEVLLWCLVLLAAGMLFEREIYGKRMVKQFVLARVAEAPMGYREKMPYLVFRFLMSVIGVLISILVAYLLGLLFFGSADDISVIFTATAIYTTYAVSRIAIDIWRMVLSPFLTQYRIPSFSDRDALTLFRWLSVLAILDSTAIMFSTWIGDFGLNYDVYALMYGASALLLSVLNILMVLSNRRAISDAICNRQRPENVAWINRCISYLWAPLVIGYIVFAWLELAFDLVLERATSIPLIAGAYGVIISILVVYGLFSYLIEQYFHRVRAVRQMNRDGEGWSDELGRSPLISRRHVMTTYEHLARRVAGVMAFVAGMYALIRIWDQQKMMIYDSGMDRFLDVVFVIFVGYIIYHLFRIWIDSKIVEETAGLQTAELGDEGGGAATVSRLGTLLPLFRNFILAVVVVSITLIVLLELGVNVSPLFAGAGVVGLAVGFGSQTLVRDIFSGAFYLFDDAFRKGEYIDIGLVKGTVERISVRSFQLRHHLGALHTIPFGNIDVLTNYSRDWVIMKLPLRVTYDTDVEKVRKLIKNLGVELLSDPVIGDNFIEPLKSQGVIEMQDSAMIIRVKFMTKPGDQWLVRKKVYEDIRALFAKEGIHFAHREVTVRLADGKVDNLTPDQKRAVTGAVQATIDAERVDEGGTSGDDR
ncbi:MAG: mechanosensitive ion channel [Rhodobacteraceae bacterium]|nr:mechanosensitive ion channel [Paracoccaceae bacterium]